MDLSIIIVTYNSGRLAKACIDSIRRGAPRAESEIIVVDNASSDDSQEVLASDIADIRFFPQEENLGYARGVNVGIAAAQGRYVLVLNPDIIVLGGAIDELLRFADARPSAAVVAGQLVNPTGSVQESCFQFYTPLTILARRTPLGLLPQARRHIDRVLLRGVDHSVPRPVDWVLGACMLVRRSAIEAVGPMDGRFFLYFEDMDWCRRFWAAGLDVWYLPTARFAHYYRRASAQDAGLGALLQPITRVHITSGFKYFWKYRRDGILPMRRASAVSRDA